MSTAPFRRITAHPTTIPSTPGAITPQAPDLDRSLTQEALLKPKDQQPSVSLDIRIQEAVARLEGLIDREEAEEQAQESRSRRSASVLPKPVTVEVSRPVLSPAERLTRARSLAQAIEPQVYLAVTDQLRGRGEAELRQSFRQIEIRLARFQHMSVDRPSRRPSASGVLSRWFGGRSVGPRGLNHVNETPLRREAKSVLRDVRQLSDDFRDAGLDAAPLKTLETKLQQIMQDAFPDYSHVPG